MAGLMFRFDTDSRPQTLLPYDFEKSRIFPEFLTCWLLPCPRWEVSGTVSLETVILSHRTNTTRPWLLAGGLDFSYCCDSVESPGQSLQTVYLPGVICQGDGDSMLPYWTPRTPIGALSPNIANVGAKAFSTFTRKYITRKAVFQVLLNRAHWQPLENQFPW